jgi:glycosyltransferase involved in cell wall biosynthesis
MSMTYGVLSTYPPTQCGLASFSESLVGALSGPADDIGVVAIVDETDDSPRAEVFHQLVRGAAGADKAAASALNSCDVAMVQHEYGIFGGRDGADVLTVVRALRVPAVVVLHTVLELPTHHQKAILEELSSAASAVVTMTQTAHDRLVALYDVDPGKVHVIPHGAADTRADTVPAASVGQAPERRDEPATRRPVVLTWGLLGQGKGIEWAIEALALLGDLEHRPRYQVVGQTHPRVLESVGETYRNGLVERVVQLDLGDTVHFDARYLGADELHRIVQAADVVLLPYDSLEQVTSGVLIEAVVAGKPVVSTAFPHAVELLSDGAGLLVPRQDPEALAAALRRVLVEPGRAQAMSDKATLLAPTLLWPTVAQHYRDLADVVCDAVPVRASA